MTYEEAIGELKCEKAYQEIYVPDRGKHWLDTLDLAIKALEFMQQHEDDLK